jgi:hypothetical protein
MRKGLLGSVAALAAGTSLAFGQAPRAGGPPTVDPTPSAIAPSLGLPPAGAVASPSVPATPNASAVLEPGVLPPRFYSEPGVIPPGYSGPGLLNSNWSPSGFYLERVWGGFEYLLWKFRNGPTHWPLAVQGTIPGGVDFTLPGAVILTGGEEFNWDFSNGGRYTVGFWLPGSTRIGIESVGTILEAKPLDAGFDAGNLSIPVLGIPFINELTANIDSLFAAFPGGGGSGGGQLRVRSMTQFYTVELNMLANLYRALYFHANLVAGVKHGSLQESTSILINSPSNPNGFFLGSANTSPIRMEDRFSTRNYFYGGQIGLQLQYRWRSLTLDYDNRIAMGVTRRILNVEGSTRAGAATAPGGLFASLSNIGSRADNEFGVIPQIRGAIGWQALQWLRLTCGIDFVYMNSVIRPGDQIDPVVNPTLVPLRPEFGAAAGTARPAQRFVTTDAWATGVSFGLHVRY